MNTPTTTLDPAPVQWPWLLTNALAWAPVPLLFYGQTLHTYLEVAGALPSYLLVGVVVGVMSGAGQALALPGTSSRQWFWTSVLGHGLALPVGLLVATLIPSLAWSLRGEGWLFMPLTVPGTVTYWPFAGSMTLAGGVVGLCQWLALRPWLARPRPSAALLWVFGVWLGVALGFFAGAAAQTAALNAGLPRSMALALFGAVWGLTGALVNMAVLAVLRPERRRL